MPSTAEKIANTSIHVKPSGQWCPDGQNGTRDERWHMLFSRLVTIVCWCWKFDLARSVPMNCRQSTRNEPFSLCLFSLALGLLDFYIYRCRYLPLSHFFSGWLPSLSPDPRRRGAKLSVEWHLVTAHRYTSDFSILSHNDWLLLLQLLLRPL